jgi:hypothetical protein
MNKLPEHVIARRDHAGQKLLALLDSSLLLAFNDKLKRWEVWNFEWDSLGMRYGFITRLLADDKRGGYAEPGEWMIDRLRARDSRYAGADEAWKNAKRELDASEAKVDAEKQAAEDARFSDLSEHVAKDYLPEFQKLSDPHWTTRQRTEWNPESVHFGQAGSKREQIREVGAA